MGIRYEKDTILNWINEMGKFLRLLVDQREGLENITHADLEIAKGYKNFFQKDRSFFEEANQTDLLEFIASLDLQQVRPLALLMMHDGILNNDTPMLEKSKFLLETNMKNTGSFSFEDFGYLADIDKILKG